MEVKNSDGTLDAIVKSKGVRFTYDNEDKLNHSMFKRLVQKLEDNLIVHYPTHFKRSATLSTITNIPLTKVIKTTLNSRFFYNYTSVPWGWKAPLP